MKKLLILYIIFFLPFCAPLKKIKREEELLRAYPIKKPIIRVGLVEGTGKIEISADSMRIWRNNGHFNLLALNAKNLVIATEIEKGKERYSIQLAAFSSRSKAEEFISKLKGIFTKEIFVEEDRVTKLFKIKTGYYSNRSEAEQDVKKAWNLKITDAWIQQEEFSKEKTDVAFLYWDGKNEKLFKGNSLMVIPSSRNVTLKFNGNLYSGIFSVIHNENGLTLVNTLNIDDYLKGVVPNELSPFTFPEIEALKAQAVAARTYALKNLGSFETNGYDICASPSCQVYNGKSSENPISSKAVEETIGEVALYKNELINALYTSTCGGATEDGENIFGGEKIPYLKSVECSVEKTREQTLKNSWTAMKSRSELDRSIKKFYPIKELLDVEVRKRGSSNRVIELAVLSNDQEILVKGYQIKAVLGLRDTLFEIEREKNRDGKITSFIFSGRGWGHGVGMCQVGAFGMARNGANYKQILKKYYKNIAVKKIY